MSGKFGWKSICIGLGTVGVVAVTGRWLLKKYIRKQRAKRIGDMLVKSLHNKAANAND